MKNMKISEAKPKAGAEPSTAPWGVAPNGAVAYAGNKLFECPECAFSATTPETLGAHIERHAPVYRPRWAKGATCPVCMGRGCFGCYFRGKRLLVWACPRGCGRHFARGSYEGAAHAAVCGGEEPFGWRLGVGAGVR